MYELLVFIIYHFHVIILIILKATEYSKWTAQIYQTKRSSMNFHAHFSLDSSALAE